MSAKSSPVVRVVRRIRANAERVFDAWLDPAQASKWLFATETGQMVRAETEPRVGGKFTFTDRRNGEDVEHTGEYLEIVRPRRLVFTFGLPKVSPHFDRVTIDIVPQGATCELTLTHEMKPEWAEYAGRTEAGWAKILAGLAASLGDLDAINERHGEFTAPGEVRFVRILPGPIERVWEYLTDPEKRAKWFVGGSMELRVGGRAELFFRHANISPHETPPPGAERYHDPGVSEAAVVTRCEPPRLLGFTFGGVEVGKSPEVTFELTPLGDNVQLVLTHRRAANRADLTDVSGGWHTHLTILLAILNGTPPPGIWSTSARLEKDYTALANALPQAVRSA
jgi:uncharacterized protein YndB with AHSA1/START domain